MLVFLKYKGNTRERGTAYELRPKPFRSVNPRVEHHPGSGILTKVFAFNNFTCRPAHHSSWSVPEPDTQPWHPFRSCLKFDVAEIALKAALNNEQMDHLLDICCRCAQKSEKLTFKNHKDVHAKWDAVSQRLTGFTKDVISIPFADKSWDFDVYYHDLWEWATDLLRDPHLFPYFHFDAQHLSKFNGQSFEQFSQLLHSAKPLTFILYADKTKLSSFGTAKGYPIVAQLMNLPTHIRNSQGMGGGYIVGWLPVVKEDKAHAGLLAWANFKATVWHKSFERILSSLAAKSKTSQWLEFLDVVQHWFFPLILILSSDFEEQSTMALTHGVRALWPCPICLVPHDKLLDMSHCYPHCTSCESQAILATTQERETTEEREEVLKEYGLCDVLNSFSTVSLMDVHCMLSWDKLHFHSGSLWSDHLWVKLQKYINVLGREKTFQVDKSYQAFPRWFMIVYATHNILTEADCPLGYLLLHCQYINKMVESDKNWNFPKLHMGSHIFDDPDEKMHGLLKDSYLLHMNFRDVAEQILHINTWQVAADHICRHLFEFDNHRCQLDEEDLLEEEDFVTTVVDCPISTCNYLHVNLGSKQPPLTFDVIQTAHQADQAFSNFRVKLNDFLNVLLPSLSIPLPEGKHIHLRGTDEITEHRFICVNYESMVDWHQHTDYLHCNPHFFGSPHFNCIFIWLTENKVILSWLVFCFECLVGNNMFPLALVHPFDDKDLNLFRVQFFSVRSFIHGALLVPDGPSDYLVVDTADTDMFLHLKMMHLEAGHIVCI
ncbi:hypothetical protein EDD22DRAFT_982430 [Suillus occidentalis]|nr:hypothetical protein EDD22DRAFT_982430 [Suillus occidentalis]